MQITRWLPLLLLAALALGSAACGAVPDATPTSRPQATIVARAPDVPPLPFPDNPDPDACGIPTRWGSDEPAWLSGFFEGELVQPTVFLYSGHLRAEITGAAPTGTPVRISLYQENPTLDYYRVETIGLDPPQSGWVPAPFLQFEPPITP